MNSEGVERRGREEENEEARGRGEEVRVRGKEGVGRGRGREGVVHYVYGRILYLYVPKSRNPCNTVAQYFVRR